MGRVKLVGANWKMNKTLAEAASFAQGLKERLDEISGCDVVLFPPFISLHLVADLLDGTPVGVGGQDLFWEERGAFTGEVSGAMIRDAGGRYVLVGHSERRHVMGETDEMVARKLGAAFSSGLIPVLCVGERLEERSGGLAKKVVETQLSKALDGVGGDLAEKLVIAYEPVWAIGTGVTATPGDAEEMHVFIRSLIADRFGTGVSGRLRIQYGGSVRPDNASELLSSGEIDGALVGGASLDLDSFMAIASAAAPRAAG